MDNEEPRVGVYGDFFVYHNPNGRLERHIRFFKGFSEEEVLVIGKRLEDLTNFEGFKTLEINRDGRTFKICVYIDKRGDVYPRKPVK